MSEGTGRLVGGRYRLGEVLGRGGMGTVWRGEDELLGRTVAVKELRFPSSVDDEEKQRLITRTLREAKAIARIRSGSAITVFDVVDEDDRPWIVMELVEGHSLADRIRRDGPLTPQRAAEVGLAVLDVLRAAHREGILHRDVKPSNVLLEEGTDRVVLTDFGIAKVEGDPSVTSTGMLVGAPSYISPERARGKPPGPPADLWSLGGLLYAAVEGHPPYDKGSAISTLTAVMTEDVPPPERAGELAEVIYGLLAKDPEKRLDVTGARALLEPVAAGPREDGDGDGGEAGEAGETGGSREGAAAVPVPVPDGDGAASKDAKASGDAKTKAEPEAGPGAAGTTGDASGSAGSRESRDSRDREGAPVAGKAASASAPAASPAARPPGADVVASLRALAGRVPRRTAGIVAVAVVAVLVVLGVIVANVLGDDGGSRNAATSSGASGGGKATGGSGKSGQDAGKAGPSPTPEPSDAKKGDDGGKKTGDGKAGKDGEGDDKGDGKPSLPDGYAMVTDHQFHFRMAMPEGFKRTGTAGQNSGGIYSAGGLPSVQVDFSDSPLKDAAAGWRKLEPSVRSNSTGYRRIGNIVKVDWHGYPTVADWQFKRVDHGRRVRVLNRGFRVDDAHGNAIMITCKAGTWGDKACRTLRHTAFATFESVD